MKNQKTIIFISILFFAISQGISAVTYYVQSPSAQILDEPIASSKGKAVAKGTELQQVGEKDMFIKVKSSNGEGWISKMHVSKFPPTSKVSLAAQTDKTAAQNARARVSSETQTAAARGLTESTTARVRGNAADYDLEAIGWLEKVSVSQKDIKQFNE